MPLLNVVQHSPRQRTGTFCCSACPLNLTPDKNCRLTFTHSHLCCKHTLASPTLLEQFPWTTGWIQRLARVRPLPAGRPWCGHCLQRRDYYLCGYTTGCLPLRLWFSCVPGSCMMLHAARSPAPVPATFITAGGWFNLAALVWFAYPLPLAVPVD